MEGSVLLIECECKIGHGYAAQKVTATPEVLWYQFNSQSGLLLDTSGNNRHASGGVLLDPDNFVEGTGSAHLQINKHLVMPSLQFQGDTTFALWFRWDLSKSPHGSWEKIMYLAENSNGHRRMQISRWDSTSTLDFTCQVVSGSETKIQLSMSFTDNIWRHLVWVMNRNSGIWLVYVDSILQRSLTTTTFLLPKYDFNYIGTHAAEPGTRSSVFGNIDDFRIYNRVVGAAEIKDLYDIGQTDSGSACEPCPYGSHKNSTPNLA